MVDQREQIALQKKEGTAVGRWVDVDGGSIWKFFSNSSSSLVKQEAELSAESETWRGGVGSLKSQGLVWSSSLKKWEKKLTLKKK